MTNRLFVYGTLLSTAGHPMGARLQREARLMGPGTVRGRLYSLGHYPGLVETERAGSLAHGELYTLKMPAVALKWLDAYEGILPDRPEESPYERVIRPVATGDGADGRRVGLSLPQERQAAAGGEGWPLDGAASLME